MHLDLLIPDFSLRHLLLFYSFQGGEDKYRRAWAQICEISRTEFHKVYQRLGVHLEEKVSNMPQALFVDDT